MYETWSLTLRKAHTLRVFEYMALRMIFGLNRDEVREEWGRLHNGELQMFVFSGLTIAGSFITTSAISSSSRATLLHGLSKSVPSGERIST